MLRIPCFTGWPSVDGGFDLRSFATICDDFGSRCYKCSTRKASCSTGVHRRHAPTYGVATKIFLLPDFRAKSVEPIVLPTRKGLKMATITTRNKTNGNPNLVDVRFDSFDPAADTVIFDVAPVLAEANVDYNTPETSPGCMSFLNDDDCVPVMSRLGLPFRDIAAGEQLFATMH